MRVTMKQLQENVDRGAALLDEAEPGWWDRIDGAALDLSNGDACVWGQLRDGFQFWSRAHNEREGIQHGFVAPALRAFSEMENGDQVLYDAQCRKLKALWLEAIAVRKAKAKRPIIKAKETQTC